MLGQQKYADAEPLCVAGYQGMKQEETHIPVPERGKLAEALKRIVQLYYAWDKKDKAEEWRKKQESAVPEHHP